MTINYNVINIWGSEIGLNAFMRTLAVTQKLFDLSVEWSIFRLHSMCSKLRLPVSEALPEVWAREGSNNVTQWHKAKLKWTGCHFFHNRRYIAVSNFSSPLWSFLAFYRQNHNETWPKWSLRWICSGGCRIAGNDEETLPNATKLRTRKTYLRTVS